VRGRAGVAVRGRAGVLQGAAGCAVCCIPKSSHDKDVGLALQWGGLTSQ